MVHDNIITSYNVDFESEILTIKTQYYSAHERTDVIFEGYLTHIFHGVMSNSMLFGIEEYPLDIFLRDEQQILSELKNCSWPITYKNEKELINYLQNNNYKTFSITATLGLYGWVLAKQMDFVVVSPSSETQSSSKNE